MAQYRVTLDHQLLNQLFIGEDRDAGVAALHEHYPELFAQPGLSVYRMPKLTLQPVVENALLHGIRKEKGRRGLIRISAREENGDLLFAISDNGIGMKEELARKLLTEARTETGISSGRGSSYGLFNVNERIKPYAGDDYGLGISSEPGAGTTVTVRLKAEREEPSKPSKPADKFTFDSR